MSEKAVFITVNKSAFDKLNDSDSNDSFTTRDGLSAFVEYHFGNYWTVVILGDEERRIF